MVTEAKQVEALVCETSQVGSSPTGHPIASKQTGRRHYADNVVQEGSTPSEATIDLQSLSPGSMGRFL